MDNTNSQYATLQKVSSSTIQRSPNTLQLLADPKQATITLSMHDVARNESTAKETCLLDSSRFMTSSSDRIDRLSSGHQIPGADGQESVSSPPWEPQHLSAITRIDGNRHGSEHQSNPPSSRDGSDAGYQTSNNSKSPSSNTTNTSPPPSVTHIKEDEELVASELKPRDQASQQEDVSTKLIRICCKLPSAGAF
jgi:hypothetical protein